MTEAQERALRKEVRSWRRPDDEFVYELVVVPQRRRGADRRAAQRQLAGRGDPPPVLPPVHPRPVDAVRLRRRQDLRRAGRPQVPRRARRDPGQVAGEAAAGTRPLPDDRDRGGGASRAGSATYFRRVFHAREGALELHLSILQGVGARYRTPFFNALKQYSHRPTGVFHALPISQGKSIVNSHWIKDMVEFYGLDVFMAETSATCGGLDSLLEPTGPLREAQQLAAEPSARGRPTSSPTAPRPRTRSSRSRWSRPATSCCSIATATSRITTG